MTIERHALPRRASPFDHAPLRDQVDDDLLGVGLHAVEAVRDLGGVRHRTGLVVRADDAAHQIEVARADLVLVLHRGEAVLDVRELTILQLHVRRHLTLGVATGHAVGAVVEVVEAGERDELELVAHRAQLVLELRDRSVVQVLAPVEGGRAVVGQHLVRELAANRLGEPSGDLEVRGAGLHPDQIRVRRVLERTVDALIDAVVLLDAPEAVARLALALVDEALLVLIEVGGVEGSALGVGARDDVRRDTHHVGREARRDEGLDEVHRRDEYLAAEMAALLLARELILEVDARGARLDHLLHQLERVELTTEAGFGVGDDRGEPVEAGLALGAVDLGAALQGAVDAAHHRRNGIRRVERLVRVHLPRQVRVRGHLPAGQVDGVQAGTHVLHRLVAGQGSHRVDVRHLGELALETLGTMPRERVLDVQAAGTQLAHVRLGVQADLALEAGVGGVEQGGDRVTTGGQEAHRSSRNEAVAARMANNLG